MSSSAQWHRVAEKERERITLTLDGQRVETLDGDTILTVILLHDARARDNEFTGSPRAGFCLMGACQECWVWREDGRRVRACSTLARAGDAILTRSPLEVWACPES